MNKQTYEKITKAIRSHPNGVSSLKILNKITTSSVYIIYPISLLVLLINGDKRFWKALFIPGVSFVLLSIFRNYYNAPRPYEVLDIVPIIDKETKGKSFPSRHVFSVFVIAMTLYYILKPLGIALMLIGIIVGIVRVLGGVHFPRDVIAGAIIGIACSIIGWLVKF